MYYYYLPLIESISLKKETQKYDDKISLNDIKLEIINIFNKSYFYDNIKKAPTQGNVKKIFEFLEDFVLSNYEKDIEQIYQNYEDIFAENYKFAIDLYKDIISILKNIKIKNKKINVNYEMMENHFNLYRKLLFQSNDLVDPFYEGLTFKDDIDFAYFLSIAFTFNFMILTNLIIYIKTTINQNKQFIIPINQIEIALKDWSLEVFSEAKMLTEPNNEIPEIDYKVELDYEEMKMAEENMDDYIRLLN